MVGFEVLELAVKAIVDLIFHDGLIEHIVGIAGLLELLTQLVNLLFYVAHNFSDFAFQRYSLPLLTGQFLTDQGDGNAA
jgi:hypothetical protein